MECMSMYITYVYYLCILSIVKYLLRASTIIYRFNPKFSDEKKMIKDYFVRMAGQGSPRALESLMNLSAAAKLKQKILSMKVMLWMQTTTQPASSGAYPIFFI